ncbi:MAG: AAA family ATPase, partial [Gemmatales bacterium]|nr:AAA family ATPase [Gemmatales bacterium]
TIVIMTSNIGSQRILMYQGLPGGSEYERMKQAVLEELRLHFRPEFLNRVDEIVVFHALSEAHLQKIVDIQLARLQKRLQERRITLQVTNAAKAYLAKQGYDPHYGARPLKRLIQREVETALAKRLLAGEVRDGQTVELDYDSRSDKLIFRVVTPNP